MSTSLARQLAALRTPATAPAVQESAYSGPFLFKEASQDCCNYSTLQENAVESLAKLVEIDVMFARFTRFISEDRLDGRLESELVEELLFLLSPFTLSRHAQWLLQLLVTKHKVHYKYPEVFFFCVLPFYEYEIYSQALLAIDTIPGGSEYPNWFLKFKQSCAPTTKLSLYKHTAADRGFLKLLCDMMLRLCKQTLEYPSLRIQRQTNMFVTTILGALENRHGVEEEQALYILQVMLNTMKSTNIELVSMAQILLSYMLPRVAFKDKTLVKLTKSLKKCIRKSASLENLILLMLMVRTQVKLDLGKAGKIMLTLVPAINLALNMEDDDAVDTQENIIYTLGLLLHPMVFKEDETSTESCSKCNQMLSLSLDILKKTKISHEALLGIVTAAYRFIKEIKEMQCEDRALGSQVESSKSLCEQMLKVVHKSYNDVYMKICVDTEDVDLFFMGDSKAVSKPSDRMVELKKVLLNNKLISFLMETFIQPIGASDKSVAKLLMKNQKDINVLLDSDPSFLLDQMTNTDFEKLMINLFSLVKTEDKPSVVKHLCSEAFITKMSSHLRLEMMLAPFFYQGESDSDVRELIIKSYLGQKSPLLSSLSSIRSENPDKFSSTVDKLTLLLTSGWVNTVLEDTLVLCMSQVVTLFLAALKNKLVIEQVDVDRDLFIKSLYMIRESLNRAHPKEKAEEKDGKSSVDNKIGKKRTNSNELLIDVIKMLKIPTDFASAKKLIEVLPTLLEKGCRDFVDSVTGLFRECLTEKADLLRFFLSVTVQTSDVKTKYLCLNLLAQILGDKSFCNELLSIAPENDLLVLLLSLAFQDNRSIRKVTFFLMEKINKEVDNSLKPVLEYFINHKVEIIDEVENLKVLLRKRGLDVESINILLTQCTRSSAPCFQTLVDLFSGLKSRSAVCSVADYGSTLLNNQTDSGTIKTIIDQFYKKIVKNIAESSCFAFFVACVKSAVVVTQAGLQKKLSECLLTNVTNAKLWQGVEEHVVEKLLTELVLNSSDVTSTKFIPFLSALNINVSMFLRQLKHIWGEENLKADSKGNFYSRASSLDFADDLRVWGRTLFVLELLDAGLATAESNKHSWEVLIQPIFAILRKLTEDDVLESSYRLNLILTVLLKLLNLTPDQKLKLLTNRDLEPELLTYCIRRSSNPESRQLSLKVLARCAVTIPEYVLQNSMTIFTFMGTHLLKMDSKHSYKIACEAIDVIVPAMRSTCTNKAELQKTSLGILNNFIHMEDDVPEHRYSEFVYRLIKALDSDSYLWIAMLLCVKSTFKAKHRVHKTNLVHRRLADLIIRFSIEDGIRGIIGVFANLRGDAPQLRSIFGCPVDRTDDKADEFDVLRLGSLVMLNKVLPSSSFVQRVGKQLDHEQESVKDLLHLLLESTILTLESFESLPDNTCNRLKSSILSQAEKTLELVLSLLPYRVYISLLGVLLASPNATLRRRAMEVVASKLDTVKTDVSGDVSRLLPSLLDLAVKETIPLNQQIALLSIRQLSLRLTDAGQLRTALETLNPKFLTELANPGVLGAATLTITDLLLAAGVVGVSFLEDTVSWMYRALDSVSTSSWEEKNVKVVSTSLLLGLQKLLEKFGGFLHPFLDQYISVACRLFNNPQASQRAKGLWSSISENVSPHLLLPRARGLMQTMWNEAGAVSKLVELIGLNCKRLERGQLNAVSKQLVEFFSFALTYRAKNGDSAQVEDTEAAIISSFLSVILRMCLDDFKPVFHQIIEKQELGDDATLTTMFNFMEKIGASLKNLFSFSVEFVLTKSTKVLAKGDSSSRLITSVLGCICRVLSFNRVTDLSLPKYEALVSALLSVYQMDNRLYPQVEDAIAALADATDDDASWKHLNFSVLMTLRNSDNKIRKQMILVIKRFVSARRDTYMVVLPDAVPFITEALEDDDQEVERLCQELIQHMETTFGQNIQAYFT